MELGFEVLNRLPGQPFSPTPASIRIPISRHDAQRPYSLIRSHHICSEPRHLCRLLGVRDIAIPAFRSPELSGAPSVTAGLRAGSLVTGEVADLAVMGEG